MFSGMCRSVSKRDGYPSGKWHPEEELSRGFRGRLIFLMHQPKMRVWCLFVVAVLFFSLAGLITSGNDTIFLFALVFVGVSIYYLVESGRAFEGLIVSVTDDGIDRLYVVYYEDGPAPYEVEFIAKCKSRAGQLQVGDSLTVVVGHPPGFGPQALILLPPGSKRSAAA